MTKKQQHSDEIIGEIISVHKTGCYVRVGDEQFFCLLKDRFKEDLTVEQRPVVNDVVVLEKLGSGGGGKDDGFLIVGIKERRSFIARYDFFKGVYQGFAANVDVVFIVTSANREFSVNRLARFMGLLENQPVRVFVVLTKIDIADDAEQYEKMLNCEFVSINCLDVRDVEKLKKLINPGETVLLLGSSGVGKSTIINTLCGLDLKTREIQDGKFANRGRHTTSARTMYYAESFKIIDTPGVRIVGLEGDNPFHR